MRPPSGVYGTHRDRSRRCNGFFDFFLISMARGAVHSRTRAASPRQVSHFRNRFGNHAARTRYLRRIIATGQRFPRETPFRLASSEPRFRAARWGAEASSHPGRWHASCTREIVDATNRDATRSARDLLGRGRRDGSKPPQSRSFARRRHGLFVAVEAIAGSRQRSIARCSLHHAGCSNDSPPRTHGCEHSG